MTIKRIYRLLVVVVFTACQPNSQNVETATAPPAQDLPQKIEACDYFSLSDIAAFWNWSEDELSQQLLMELEKYDKSHCLYFIPTDEKCMVRTNWQNAKAQQNGVLSRQYATYLQSGEDNLSYSALAADDYTETLFGQGPDRDDKTIYVLRKRYTEEVEVIIEAALRREDAEMVKSVLLSMMDAL